MRQRGEEKDLVIILVYMPTSQHPEEEIDEQYELIEEIIEKDTKEPCVMFMGDWNAVAGEGQYRNIVGKYSLRKRNDRGIKLIEFCERNGLIIGNTIFKHYKRR